MHISDPVEKVWFRERMEKEENQLKFTGNGKKAILNKLIQAEKSFAKAVSLKTDFIHAYYHMGNTKYKLKKFDESELNYEKAILFIASYFLTERVRRVISSAWY
mgnify:CR=1 FL=1